MRDDSEWVYGLHAVQVLLKTDAERVLELRVAASRDDQRLQRLVQQAERAELTLVSCSRRDLDELTDGARHQGVAALCRGGELRDERFLHQLLDGLDEAPFLLVLDGVTDPHNLGACLRTADACGVQAVVVPKDNAVGVNATVRKVACGAAETVPVVTVTNLVRALEALKERGIWVYGTAGEARQSVFEQDFSGAVALVLGAEGKGLRRLTREACDHLVMIPMRGSVESLNVSVATGVCLYQVARSRL